MNRGVLLATSPMIPESDSTEDSQIFIDQDSLAKKSCLSDHNTYACFASDSQLLSYPCMLTSYHLHLDNEAQLYATFQPSTPTLEDREKNVV